MTDFADDAQSTFSHAITLQDDNEKANVDDNDYRFETGTLQEKPSLTEKTKKDDDSTASMSKPSDVGSLRVIYGPGTNCVVVSSLIGCKWYAPRYLASPDPPPHQNTVLLLYPLPN